MEHTIRGIVMQALSRQMYLDTNIWSDLAKGSLPSERLESWLDQHDAYFVLSGIQLAELAARPDLVEPLVDSFYRLRTVLLDRGDREIYGDRWVFNSSYPVLIYLSDVAHRPSRRAN